MSHKTGGAKPQIRLFRSQDAVQWSLKKRTIECKLRKQGKKASASTVLTGDALVAYLNQQEKQA
jgi:hypothetical protein